MVLCKQDGGGNNKNPTAQVSSLVKAYECTREACVSVIPILTNDVTTLIGNGRHVNTLKRARDHGVPRDNSYQALQQDRSRKRHAPQLKTTTTVESEEPEEDAGEARCRLLAGARVDIAWLVANEDAPGVAWMPLAHSMHTDLVSRLRLERESVLKPDQGAWRAHSTVSADKRMRIVDWMQLVSNDFSMSRHATHLAIGYFDRCLGISTRTSMHTALATPGDTCVDMLVTTSNDMTIAATCMWIASKLEEMNPARASEFVNVSANKITVKGMEEMQRTVAHALQWKMRNTTVFECVRAYLAGVAEAVHGAYREEVTAVGGVAASLHLLEVEQRLSRIRHDLLRTLRTLLATHTFAKAMQIADVFSMHAFSMHFCASRVAASVLYVVLPQTVHTLITRVTGMSTEVLRPILSCLSLYTHRLPDVSAMPSNLKHQAERLFIPVESMYTRQLVACPGAPSVVWHALLPVMCQHESAYLSPPRCEPMRSSFPTRSLETIAWSARYAGSPVSDTSLSSSRASSPSSSSGISCSDFVEFGTPFGGRSGDSCASSTVSTPDTALDALSMSYIDEYRCHETLDDNAAICCVCD